MKSVDKHLRTKKLIASKYLPTGNLLISREKHNNLTVRKNGRQPLNQEIKVNTTIMGKSISCISCNSLSRGHGFTSLGFLQKCMT